VGSSELTSGADSVRSYTPEENRRLSDNLLAITQRLHAGELVDRPPSTDVLLSFHAHLFQGVRDHAGRHRDRGFGQEHVTFGPNRSIHRNEVSRQLRETFDRASRDLRALLDEPGAADYEKRGIWLAVWTHAEVIRVHPFEDGNGRTSRLMMSHILIALGLLPIPVEACKDEYNLALNIYFETKDGGTLLDLFLRLYPLPPS
jgi:fido (protein-threonine AMPylation protein)